jgi:hypothetical protein
MLFEGGLRGHLCGVLNDDVRNAGEPSHISLQAVSSSEWLTTFDQTIEEIRENDLCSCCPLGGDKLDKLVADIMGSDDVAKVLAYLELGERLKTYESFKHAYCFLCKASELCNADMKTKQYYYDCALNISQMMINGDLEDVLENSEEVGKAKLRYLVEKFPKCSEASNYLLGYCEEEGECPPHPSLSAAVSI